MSYGKCQQENAIAFRIDQWLRVKKSSLGARVESCWLIYPLTCVLYAQKCLRLCWLTYHCTFSGWHLFCMHRNVCACVDRILSVTDSGFICIGKCLCQYISFCECSAWWQGFCLHREMFVLDLTYYLLVFLLLTVVLCAEKCLCSCWLIYLYGHLVCSL